MFISDNVPSACALCIYSVFSPRTCTDKIFLDIWVISHENNYWNVTYKAPSYNHLIFMLFIMAFLLTVHRWILLKFALKNIIFLLTVHRWILLKFALKKIILIAYIAALCLVYLYSLCITHYTLLELYIVQ